MLEDALRCSLSSWEPWVCEAGAEPKQQQQNEEHGQHRGHRAQTPAGHQPHTVPTLRALGEKPGDSSEIGPRTGMRTSQGL